MADFIDDDDRQPDRTRSGLHEAVGQTSEGIAEFRRVVRAQPIAMALVMLGFGYVIGRVLSAKSLSD